MQLADKIIVLRRRKGWSQEELAERLEVSRQSVSKWEMGQSVPELEKLLLMGKVFGVSMDDLLKEDHEALFCEENSAGASARREEAREPFYEVPTEEEKPKRILQRAEAEEYLALRQKASWKIALGVLLCILSPLPMFLLLGAGTIGVLISEAVALGVGIPLLLLLVACACMLFIFSSVATSPYAFLSEQRFEPADGVRKMVEEQKKQYRPSYRLWLMVGVFLLILAALPLVITAILVEQEGAILLALCGTLLVVALGVMCLVQSGVVWSSMQCLLGEGEYAEKREEKSKLEEAVSSTYWSLVIAAYLAYSFITSDWGRSWIVWPVAGVLFGVVEAILAYRTSKEKKQK